MSNKITISPIINTIIEAENIKTILFQHPEAINPGQFYMIWIPGIDEIPMSVSIINNDVKGITFRVVGEATEALYQKTIHDKIGIRGPYGKGFSLKGNNLLFVAGGTGTAMIAPAVEQALKQNKKATVILGAKTKRELFFTKRLQETDANTQVTTDDGSFGFKGFATTKAKELIKNGNFDAVYTCGPELMMKELYYTCEKENIIFEASLERYMKCAIGICGQCVIGKGIRVCVEGPIFSKSQLHEIPDFGVFKRDASGKKIEV